MRTHFQPVPVGGWNASTPLDLMPPQDAARLINFIPREKSLEMRQGSIKLTTSALGKAVETLATHRDEDGTETLVALADDKAYSVNTSTGATTQIASGFSNNRWQTVNFNNYLLCVNGQNAPQQYDGTTFGNYSSPITGTGLTATDVVGVCVFKGRCYYWENNKAKFWYAAAGAYGGALTAFPLGVTTNKGGYVKECMTWTRDSGDGVDDLFVVIMSTGETLVYQGADASAFSLVGRFNLGAPVGIKGSTNLASDRIIITEDGFVNLSTALQVGRVSEKGNVSTKIIEAAKEAVRKRTNNYGWEIFYHDKQSLLMVNIPIKTGSTDPTEDVYDQYCMNTNTGAWTRFIGWNGISFTEVGGELYMGSSDGHVRKCFAGTNDDDKSIKYVVIPSYTMMNAPDRKKQLTMVTLTTNFLFKDNIGIGGLADFDDKGRGAASVPQANQGQIGEWDTSDWDEDYWGSVVSDEKLDYIYPVSKDGYSLSVKINIFSDAQTAHIYALRYKYKFMRTI